MSKRSDDAASWLTRGQIDEVIASMSAADLLEAMGDSDKIVGPKMAGKAFDSAAARIGVSNGTPALEHVTMADFVYLANEITKAVNLDAPLSEGEQG